MLVVLIGFISCVFLYILWKITDNTHNKPNAVKYWYNFCAFYFATTVGCFLILPICFARPKNVLNGNVGATIITRISNLLIKDFHFQLRNGEILSEERGAVIIGNHQSSMDILGVFNLWTIINKLSVVSKQELFYLWPFGLSAYLSGVIFINRKDSKSAYRQFEETSKAMVKDKRKIFLFPEGTRNGGAKNFLPFKKGAFSMAVKAQVPIIPIVFSPYYFIDSKKHIFNKGHVIIQCLEPVPTIGLTMDEVPALSEKLREIMTDAYQKLKTEVMGELASEYCTNKLN